MKVTRSSIDVLRKALSESFPPKKRRSFVIFGNSHLELDLKGFMTSPAGRVSIGHEVELAKNVPSAPLDSHEKGVRPLIAA